MSEVDKLERGDEVLCAEVYSVPFGTSELGTSTWLVLRWSEARSAYWRVGIMPSFERQPYEFDFNDTGAVGSLLEEAVYRKITIM